MNVNPRRTQADRSAATREALVAAARALFRDHGFGGVGTEAIVREAGVTRGALYHQFADKTELFAAVVEAVERDVNAGIGAAVADAGVTDPIDVMVLGARAWLEACGRPEVQRILLLDAPAVLGWERWREIGMKYGMGLLEGLIAHAIELGRIPAQPVRPLAHIVIGALDEAALYVARSDDQETARAEIGAVVERLIASLASA
jgi:AcrR family transcriptional regulator